VFRDRRHAGAVLGELVRAHVSPDGGRVVVLGIPRGGVVVAAQVARALGAELDLAVPRKLRAPHNPELAVGAVAEDGSVYVDERVASSLRVPSDYLQQEVAQQLEEIRRRVQAYRQGRPPVELAGRTVVLVDDGVATGSTMIAAVRSARRRGAARVVVAVPVAPPEAVRRLREEGCEVLCVREDPLFVAVGQFYEDFTQVSDAEVRGLLEEFWRKEGAGGT
jgi:putative phosphoribosyl transferase